MAYWIGLAFVGGGAWFVWSALRYRKRAIAELARLKARGEAPPKLHPSLSILADAAPALATFFILCVAALTVLAFFATNAQQHLSLFDLAAYLGFLGAYAFWLNTKTTYRLTEFDGAAVGSTAD